MASTPGRQTEGRTDRWTAVPWNRQPGQRCRQKDRPTIRGFGYDSVSLWIRACVTHERWAVRGIRLPSDLASDLPFRPRVPDDRSQAHTDVSSSQRAPTMGCTRVHRVQRRFRGLFREELTQSSPVKVENQKVFFLSRSNVRPRPAVSKVKTLTAALFPYVLSPLPPTLTISLLPIWDCQRYRMVLQ